MEISSKLDKYITSLIETFIHESPELKEVVGLAVDKNSEILIDFACDLCKNLVYDP